MTNTDDIELNENQEEKMEKGKDCNIYLIFLLVGIKIDSFSGS